MGEYQADASFEMIGAFWKYGEQESPFTGTLTSHKGRVEVVAAPSYRADLDGIAFRNSGELIRSKHKPVRLPSICGFTTDNYCTLLNSLVLDGGGNAKLPLNRKISAKRYVAARTVMGLHVESAEAKSLNSGAFYLTKIHHLLPAPWAFELSDDSFSYRVPKGCKEVFKFASTDIDAEVVCEVVASSGSKVKKGAWIRSIPRVRIIPNSPQSVNWFVSLAVRVENFFTLILGTSVSLKRIQLFQDSEAGWVVQKMNRHKEAVDVQTWVRCPLQIVGESCAKWLAVPINKRPAELVLLGMLRKSTLYEETEFLSLAQALEGFGRIRNSCDAKKKLSFASLIEQTYDLLSVEFASRLLGDRAAFIKKIVHTRNYYTHLGNEKGLDATQDNKELFLLNKRLQAFLRCAMLIEMGVPEQYLEEPILYQANRWKM